MEERLDVNYNAPTYSFFVEKLHKAFGKRLKTIGEIADVICGPFGSAIKSVDYRKSPGIPLIRIANISSDGYMDYSDLVYIDEKLGNSLSRTQVSKGDIVISQRGSLGQCAVVDNKFEKQNISANIIAIKRISTTSASFMRDYLLSSVGQKLLERNMSGQVQPKITTKDIENIPFPIGCNEKKMSAFLQKARKAYLEKLQQADELLKSLNQYILAALNITIKEPKLKLCSATHRKDIKQAETLSVEYYHPERMTAINALHENPSLKVKPLSMVVDFQRNIVNAAESPEKYLGLAGVESHTGELTDIVEEADGQAFTYQIGDVLYGRLRPYLNKVLCAEQAGICSTEFHVMRVKNKSELLPEYLAEIMRSNLILAQTKHMMTGNTHPRIANNDVKNLCIPVPSLSIQQEITNEIGTRRREARALRQNAEKEWAAAKRQFEKELLGE